MQYCYPREGLFRVIVYWQWWISTSGESHSIHGLGLRSHLGDEPLLYVLQISPGAPWPEWTKVNSQSTDYGPHLNQYYPSLAT